MEHEQKTHKHHGPVTAPPVVDAPLSDELAGKARDALFSIAQSAIKSLAARANAHPELLTPSEVSEVSTMQVMVAQYEARLRQIVERIASV